MAKSKKKPAIVKAINYWTIGGFEGDKPVAQAMQEAKDMGFEGIELCFGAGELTPKTTESKCREIKKAARDIGVKLESMATGAYWDISLSSTKKSERQKAIKFTQSYIETAAHLGVKRILVVPGAVDVPWEAKVPHVPYDEAWKESQRSLKKVLPAAEEHKVYVCLENVWNRFLYAPMEMKFFIDSFDSRYIGSYFDVGNCILNGEAEDWIRILRKRIKAIHFKNFERQDCAGVLHGFGDDLMKGDVNFKEAMKALKEIEYSGPVTAEMIPFSRLPDLVLPDMKMAKDTSKKMDKILAM